MTRSAFGQTAEPTPFIFANMPVRYAIAPSPQGWVVLEDGTPLEVHPERTMAAEMAELLATVARALGRPATFAETEPN